MTDAQLVQKFLAGDLDSFNLIVWRWEKGVYNFILRYTGDREESKDICQLTFIRAYRKLHRLRDPDKFSSWLYQIAINICRDELKKKKRRKVFSLEHLQENRNGSENPIPEMEMDEKTNPETVTHERELADLLQRALQVIPEEQRLVIIMKEYQGLKFIEIAEILQTSVNTVKSRMYYGLAALRKVFKQWEINEEMVQYEM